MRRNTALSYAIESCIEFSPLSYKGKIAAKHLLRAVWLNELNWDPWLLKDEDCYRLFYLSGANYSPQKPWWRLKSRICGAISKDLVNWIPLGTILEATTENSWESGRIFAGSTYKENGIYYLFYSAAGEGEAFLDEAVGLATSTDGITWKRCAEKPLLEISSDNEWYGKHKDHLQCRDPWIVKEPNTGKYYMFVAAHAKEKGSTQRFGGCIGLAVADQIHGPYTMLPSPVKPFEDVQLSPFYEMERPQVIYRHGKYHLFFSSFVSSLNPQWVPNVPHPGVNDSTVYWYVADCINGPYRPSSEYPIVKGSDRTGMYGTNFFPDPDNEDEFIAYGWRHRLFSLEVKPSYRVRWDKDHLEIRKSPIRKI